MNPLMNANLVTLDKVNRIFGGIEILTEFQIGFLLSISERLSSWNGQQTFGDLFLNEANFLVIYSQYVNNYERSLETIRKECEENKDFEQFLLKCEQDPECNLSDLGSLLIQPIQRVSFSK
jgi:hypothetical protein